jgi:hypothetical protein
MEANNTNRPQQFMFLLITVISIVMPTKTILVKIISINFDKNIHNKFAEL